LIHVAPRCKYKIKLSKVFYLYRFFEDLYFQVEFRASVSDFNISLYFKIQNGVWNQSLAENLRTAPMRCLDWQTPEEALERELAFDTS
jgi:hypothetical protein